MSQASRFSTETRLGPRLPPHLVQWRIREGDNVVTQDLGKHHDPVLSPGCVQPAHLADPGNRSMTVQCGTEKLGPFLHHLCTRQPRQSSPRLRGLTKTFVFGNVANTVGNTMAGTTMKDI